jgi:molecular chaperone GrpE
VELAAEVARLTEELRQANDQALRSQAELENFRKRMRREMEEERKYASLPLIVELLNVLDNLAWAIEAGQNATQTMALSDGVKMVAAQLTTLLGKHHCQAIPTIGKEFDPHLHEALAKEPSELHPEGVITRAARSGYRLHDRVIRPAQVFVSSGNPPAPAAEPPGTVESMANPE